MHNCPTPKVLGIELLTQLKALAQRIDPRAEYETTVRSTLYRFAGQVGLCAENQGFESDNDAVLAAMRQLNRQCQPAVIARHLQQKMEYKRYRPKRAFRNTVIECLDRLERQDLVKRNDETGVPLYRLSPLDRDGQS